MFKPAIAEIQLHQVGNPTWKPTGFVFASLPLADSAITSDGTNRNILDTYSDALGDSHVWSDDPYADYLPGEPLDGPYDDIFRRAVATMGGINTDVFLADELVAPDILLDNYVIVPTSGAPTGPSPDASNGPILPDSLFPISSLRTITRNGGQEHQYDDFGETRALSELEGVTDENGDEPNFEGLSWSHTGNQNWISLRPGSSVSRVLGEWVLTREMRDDQNNGWDVVRSFLVVREATDLLGDLSYDDELDLHDLNILTQNVAMGANNLRLDLNHDETVNVDDVHHWVTQLKSTNIGDTNLDGDVNFADFLTLSENFGMPGGWGEGDFDANERVEFSDFLALSENFGQNTGAAAATVPEPSGLLLAVLGCVWLSRWRRGTDVCSVNPQPCRRDMT